VQRNRTFHQARRWRGIEAGGEAYSKSALQEGHVTVHPSPAQRYIAQNAAARKAASSRACWQRAASGTIHPVAAVRMPMFLAAKMEEKRTFAEEESRRGVAAPVRYAVAPPAQRGPSPPRSPRV